MNNKIYIAIKITIEVAKLITRSAKFRNIWAFKLTRKLLGSFIII